MGEVSFEVKQDALSLVQNTVIEANFDAVKESLTEMVAPYKSMIVSEDGIASAKNDRARIRNVASRVDEVRRMVKKAYTEPLAVFEGRCKELVAICAEGSDNLDRQIKAFEDSEKQAKIAELREVYDTYPNDEARYYLPWDAIYNPKWGNKTYALEQAKGEINHALERTDRDLSAIRSMAGENTAYLLDTYAQTRDISAVIRKNTELNARKAIEEQRRKEAEERRKAEEEAARQRQAARLEEKESTEPVAPPAPPVVTTRTDETFTIAFKVTGTRDQLNALAQFMRNNNITYRRAKE